VKEGEIFDQFMAMIALMVEAASTSETSVSFYQTTRRNNLEDSHLNTRRENLKSHLARNCLQETFYMQPISCNLFPLCMTRLRLFIL
jgi:hypothetical protein